MANPFEISDQLTEDWAASDPISATSYGITQYNGDCTDYSPEGQEHRASLYRAAREALEPHRDHEDPAQALAARVLIAEMTSMLARHDTGEWRRDLNHIFSPFQGMRDVFDVMPKKTPSDWEDIRSRLDGFGRMLDGYIECLAVGVGSGETVAERQVLSMLEQVEHTASEDSTFETFAGLASASGVDPEPIARAAKEARAACSRFASWLRDDYLPIATPSDAVGEEKYLQQADRFLGMAIDPKETYEWGWSEVHRLRSEMTATAGDVDATKTVEEVIEMLENDPERSASSREGFANFVSDLQWQAIEQLDGEHFDVPHELKKITVNIAPPGVPLGAWYVGPSEDFSRPGSIWYAPGEREHIPYWQEVSTAYHEGFPGHHLQVGTAIYERESLSRFHRAVIWYPGSGEGWALYAERLMDELGFFEKPEYRLGWLVSQLFRSVRVVLDIGCQLELQIPADAPLYPGEVWDYDKGVDYMDLVALQPRDVAASEVKRYLGWWGQAISYKVGEREILSIRDDVRRRDGSLFDRKDFHRKVLQTGAIRLDHLRRELV